MARKVRRVPYHLDSKGVGHLPPEEIAAILRGADDLIMSGGRTLLAKILKGSRQKKVLELGLNSSPVYGYYRDLREEEVLARIDWVIEQGYLAIAYDYRLPLLIYTPAGWQIEKETYAHELFEDFDALLEAGPPYPMEYLKDCKRDLIWRVLDLVEATGDPKYIPLLEAWQQVDYRKVRERINRVIRHLTSPAA